MNKWLFIVAIMMALLSFADVPQNEKTVIATGVGTSKENSISNALSNAIAQVVGTMVDIEALIESNEIIKNQILTHSNGVVSDYDIISQRKDGNGTYIVTLKAVVQQNAVYGQLTDTKIFKGKVKDPKNGVQHLPKDQSEAIPKEITVVAWGEGITQEDSINNALSEAIQQVIGFMLDGDNQFQNEEIIKDEVFAHADAVISKYDLTSRPHKGDDGLYSVQIKAVVLQKAVHERLVNAGVIKVGIKDTEARVKNLLSSQENGEKNITELFNLLKTEELLYVCSLDSNGTVLEEPQFVFEPITGKNDECLLTGFIGIGIDMDKYQKLVEKVKPLLQLLGRKDFESNPKIMNNSSIDYYGQWHSIGPCFSFADANYELGMYGYGQDFSKDYKYIHLIALIDRTHYKIERYLINEEFRLQFKNHLNAFQLQEGKKQFYVDFVLDTDIHYSYELKQGMPFRLHSQYWGKNNLFIGPGLLNQRYPDSQGDYITSRRSQMVMTKFMDFKLSYDRLKQTKSIGFLYQ